MAEKGRNNASKRSSRADRSLRKAINKAVLDAVGDDTGRAISDSDRNLMNEMLGRAGTALGGLSDAERTDLKMFREMAPSKPRMPKPRIRPDVGAIERGNNAAKRTAQDLATMEAGGLVGGQKKLDKNKDGKISGADFKMMKKGGKVKKMKGGGQVCRGGGAAMSGTRFSGVK